jgi:hypothetical protein
MRRPEWLLRNVFPLREGVGVLIGQREEASPECPVRR